MINLGLLPILILVIIGIGFFKLQHREPSLKKKREHRPIKLAHWMFYGYIGVLLISAVLYAFIPNEQATEKNTDLSWSKLYHDTFKGNPDVINPKLIKNSWVKEYRGKQLNISVKDDNTIDIFIDRKNDNDGKIEGFLYQSNTFVNGLSIDTHFEPNYLYWSGDTLAITPPIEKKLKFVSSNREFIVAQFMDDRDHDHSEFALGRQILYLRIPSDLKIINNARFNIQFVDK